MPCLGRHYVEILEQWRVITKEKGAAIEPDFIKYRQAEGIAAAKARGVKFGRPLKKLPDNYPKVRDAWKAGKLLGINPQTFLRRVRSKEC